MTVCTLEAHLLGVRCEVARKNFEFPVIKGDTMVVI